MILTPRVSKHLKRGAVAIRSFTRAVWEIRAEILTATGLIGGWLLVTWGLPAITSWKVWPISIGILLLSAAGWEFILNLARKGLYHLSREENR